MLITDKETLKKYAHEKRLWQGIPGIEVTKNGRIFVCFYSGGIREELGNYALLIYSDDGVNFSEPIAAVYKDERHRCFDSCVWIDPLGRLWLTWAMSPDDGQYAAVCDDPDADELTWSEPFFIGHNVMLNKPTVLSTGEWLFPIAIWGRDIVPPSPGYDADAFPETGAFAYVTYDNGKTFQRLGAADVESRSYCEHMILEMKDGTLKNFMRTSYGIGVADSYDRGKSWSKGYDAGYSGTCSRFHIRRLKSGRILLITHYDTKSRNNLTAMLSEDEGVTFPYRLLLDERKAVSYPDAVEADDGFIYVTYDRERGSFLKSLSAALAAEREILTARITEDDIINGSLKHKGSYLKRVACKLSAYAGDDPNPYHEPDRYSDEEYAQYISKHSKKDRVISEIFFTYPLICSCIHNLDAKKLDRLIDSYYREASDPLPILSEIINTVRSVSDADGVSDQVVVQQVCSYISEHFAENQPLDVIANNLNYSQSYLQHIFKKHTGVSIVQYRNELRLTKAKLLLIDSQIRIIDVALTCGFDDPSYFSRIFKREIGITPEQYRAIHK